MLSCIPGGFGARFGFPWFGTGLGLGCVRGTEGAGELLPPNRVDLFGSTLRLPMGLVTAEVGPFEGDELGGVDGA